MNDEEQVVVEKVDFGKAIVDGISNALVGRILGDVLSRLTDADIETIKRAAIAKALDKLNEERSWRTEEWVDEAIKSGIKLELQRRDYESKIRLALDKFEQGDGIDRIAAISAERTVASIMQWMKTGWRDVMYDKLGKAFAEALREAREKR